MTIDHIEVSVVKPKYTKNLCKNPSFEVDTTGWTAGATNTIARSLEQAKFGLCSAKCTVNTGTYCSVYNVTLPSAGNYAFSVYVYIPSSYDGSQIQLRPIDWTNSVLVADDADMTKRDQWQRLSVVKLIDASDLVGNFVVWQSGTLATAGRYIYVDAILIESGDAATTYFDGDSEGFTKGRIVEYWWDSRRHGSVSIRSEKTYSGGELVPFGDYCTLVRVFGLGNSPVKALSIPLTDGSERYLRSHRTSRPFTLSVVFEGSSVGAIDAKRLALMDLLNPVADEFNQPIHLVFQGYDSNDAGNSKMVFVKCVYMSGLDGSPQTNIAYQVDVTFKLFDVAMYGDGTISEPLLQESALVYIAGLVVRDTDGQWMDIGASLDYATESIKQIAENPVDGMVYFVGNFTGFGGITGLDYLARFLGMEVSPKFESPLTGADPNNVVNCVEFDGDGNIYIGGPFTSVGGSTRTYCAKINPDGTINSTDWSAYDIPVTMLFMGSQIYAGQASGLDTAAISTGVWTSDTSLGAVSVTLLRRSLDREKAYLYEATNHKLYYGSYNYWTLIGTCTGGDILDLTIDEKGYVFAVGDFTAIDGVSADGLAWYDGVDWHSGTFSEYTPTSPSDSIIKTVDGFRIGGKAGWSGGRVIPGLIEYFEYDRGVISDFLAGGFTDSCLCLDQKGRLWYGGGGRTGSAGRVAYKNTFNNPGDKTYPIIYIEGTYGAYLYYIGNETTGKKIFFDRLYLSEGEILKCDLRPDKMSFISNLGRNYGEYVNEASSLDFPIVKGDNILFLMGEGLGIYLQIKETFDKLDGWVL